MHYEIPFLPDDETHGVFSAEMLTDINAKRNTPAEQQQVWTWLAHH